MQYLYSQEEHDRVKTDKEEFERRVAAGIDSQLAIARARVAQVIEDFFKHYLTSSDACHFGAQIDYRGLKSFSNQLHAANKIPVAKESCDRDTGTVVK
jgi:hypothetical protein